MLTELEAILSSELSTMVFVYGSAAMLVGSMIAVSWLCGSRSSPMSQPSFGVQGYS
jgi:hypothetical protein